MTRAIDARAPGGATMSLTVTPPRPVSLARADRGDGLVDIVSGSFGAGHDAAGREIARRLEARGFATRTWDIVDLMPGAVGRALRAGYLRQVQSLPATWSWTLRSVEAHPSVARGVVRAMGMAEPGLLALAADGPVAIVSTHPFASQALGRLRQSGRLDIPVVTYLTDMSVHPLWVHPAVDLHLAVHALPAAQARSLGGRAVVVNPLAGAASAPRTSGSVAALRGRLGLPVAGP